jgi:lipopolysaccharide export system protein LptA
MYGNSKTNTAKFWGAVRVLNLPCKDPYVVIDLDVMLVDLPKDAMYLSCDQLTVLNRGDKNQSRQEMLARGRVLVQSQEFWGRSDTVTYDEAKDQIIFDGGDGVATLYRILRKGEKPDEIKGKKITYLRSTGAFKVDDGQWISGK